MNQLAQIDDAKYTLIGRLFTLGGSVFFFIGSLIVAILAYKSYQDLLQPQA
ncbi:MULTISPECIES: hypothetical protein [Paenibacillus]|uniref:hypothetical protein n=1 Tax=Paenibacillus TaxID=44249 RepID=UPI000390060D|nr:MULTISPECIES: hypothetical protein [Paenibacillus]CDN42548.1 Uncharacterized protein BN871_BM_00170 [Paenibacillus sp. P22]